MTANLVDAVFFWSVVGTTNFKVTYGRRPGSSYSKDFHQPRHDLARAIEKTLGVGYGGETPVEWRWPGGSDTRGLLKPASDFAQQGGRLNLRWETDHAPAPWRAIPNPTAATLETLQGTPDLTDETKANQQHAAIVASGERPWLVAVHLVGEGPVLHARLVLENPAPGRAFASWDNLPQPVRDEMQRTRDDQGGFYLFPEGELMSDKLVHRILAAFEDSPNVLLVGPPGTGKTVAMEKVSALYSGTPAPSVTFDPDLLHGAFGASETPPSSSRRLVSLLFHPSYSYEHFVMGLLPDIVDGQVAVKPHVGPLLELAQFAAHAPDNKALLVLDEFNRGNAAAIFGDTLGLLDQDKRDVAFVDTPYKHLTPMTALGGALGPTTTLPKDLRVLAAMNSADRSVAPLDAALRRRFSIIHVDPDVDVLRRHLKADFSGDLKVSDPATWTTPERVAAVAVRILESLNKRIEFVLGRDFLLGQSVFWHLDLTDVDCALTSLAAALDNRVLGTLALSFTDDDEGLAAVLNIDGAGAGKAAAKWATPPIELTRWPNRLRPARFQDFDGPILREALVSLLDPTLIAAHDTSEVASASDAPGEGTAVVTEGADKDEDAEA
ncbi:McrB family protein [Microbacterium sp.]|uniref:McrB family protein n=1 Tax=Microbacterium sp. TaxID=51671 RepID=UPI002732B2BE|nr:AAA family ATPase [Microbacterium sp.]MDP3949183.1 AAA family ATPase [Microbacterium sp.]